MVSNRAGSPIPFDREHLGSRRGAQPVLEHQKKRRVQRRLNPYDRALGERRRSDSCRADSCRAIYRLADRRNPAVTARQKDPKHQEHRRSAQPKDPAALSGAIIGSAPRHLPSHENRLGRCLNDDIFTWHHAPECIQSTQ